MDVLSARILLRPTDAAATQRFYRDTLGLAVAREFGPPEHPGMVFFLGGALLEVSGRGPRTAREGMRIWVQVRDADAEHRRLADAGVRILRAPRREPWGLIEMWISDPDGVQLVLVEVPQNHPLRKDTRTP